MSRIDPLDAELRDLWGRRRDLKESEWARLYAIVMGVLMKYKPRELAGLQEEREVYILDFFQDKVLRLDLMSNCDHVGALRLYYQRYLRDLLRSLKSRARREVADEHDPDSESPPSLDEAPDLNIDDRDPLDELTDAGIAPAQVAKSAAAWFGAAEEWVRLFIALSNCPDADLSEPLVRLAKRTGIKSRAYKAEQLGFNWGGDFVGFAQTLLGRWIESLGIEILPENRSLILGALKILCFEALSWAEQQEAAA